MRLIFQSSCLGEIEDLFFDQPEVHGMFKPSAGIEEFQQLFAWMVDEDNSSEEPPFDADLLDDSNWFVIDDSGERRGITVPGVYADGEIIWRWRNE